MDDYNSMLERVLGSLEKIFIDNQQLNEFVIVPTEANTTNKSPVLFHEEELSIGLESWCIKHIYPYVYKNLFEARPLLRRNRLSFAKERELNRFLIAALLINPDVSTFWNMKRELVENEAVTIAQELLFSKVVLTYKHKSNEAFAYRRWLLNRLLDRMPPNPEAILHDEFELVIFVGTRSSHNYHAWAHRIWCMEKFLSRLENPHRVLMGELQFSKSWLKIHVSEYNGFHYRQYLLEKLCKLDQEYQFHRPSECIVSLHRDAHEHLNLLLAQNLKRLSPEQIVDRFDRSDMCICFLYKDLCITADNLLFPEYHSMWYHRRFLLYKFLTIFHEYHGLCSADFPARLRPTMKIDDSQLKYADANALGSDLLVFKPKPIVHSDKESVHNTIRNSSLYLNLQQFEIGVIDHFSKDKRDGVRQLAKAQQKWMKFVIGMDINVNF